MNIASIVKKNSITIYLGNKVENIANDHPNFEAIKTALVNKEYEGLEELISIPKSLNNFSSGAVTIENGELLLSGKVLHTTLARRVLNLKTEGFPFEHMLEFVKNLYLNPSNNSIEQLYTFLENKGLPITDDGHFIAYKAVRENYLDKYSGTISNHIGAVVTMPRNEVADDSTVECSTGLHCGAMEYVNNYGNGDSDKILVVKVNPTDAVSVPRDHDFQKLRVCRYEVIGELENTAQEFRQASVSTRPSTDHPSVQEQADRLRRRD